MCIGVRLTVTVAALRLDAGMAIDEEGMGKCLEPHNPKPDPFSPLTPFRPDPFSRSFRLFALSNLVRLPLLFVSGVFMPIGPMLVWVRWIAPLSPLSYASALIRSAFGHSAFFPVWLSLLMLALFTLALFLASCKFHNMWRAKGL